MAIQKIKIGLAGFGMSAQVLHLPFWRADVRLEVVRMFERSGNKAQAVLPQAQTVRSFEELLADNVDLVVIITPNQTHFDFTAQALRTGKDVVMKKPLCITTAQALELAELAERQGVLLTVYQNRRWDSAPLTARKLFSDSLLGEIVDAGLRFERYAAALNKKRWKETGEADVGLVYDLGSHLMDMAINVFGIPDELYADVRYQHEEAASDGNFHIALYRVDGKKVVLTASKYAHEPSPFMTLHGKRGSYVKQNADNQEALLPGGAQPAGVRNRELEDEQDILHTEIDGVVVRKKIESVSGNYTTFYENLYDTLRGKSPATVQPRQVAEVLWLLEKVYESAKSGCRVRV